jgi:hypothetical protein
LIVVGPWSWNHLENHSTNPKLESWRPSSSRRLSRVHTVLQQARLWVHLWMLPYIKCCSRWHPNRAPCF